MGANCYNSRQNTMTCEANFDTNPEIILDLNIPKLQGPVASQVLTFHTHEGLKSRKSKRQVTSKKTKAVTEYNSSKELCVSSKFLQSGDKIGGNYHTAQNAFAAKLLQDSYNEDQFPKAQSSLACPHMNPSPRLDVTPQRFRIEKKGKLEDLYEIKELIGKGGFGEVKKIRNKITNEIRALKIMLKSKCQMTKEISDEISILQKLVKNKRNF